MTLDLEAVADATVVLPTAGASGAANPPANPGQPSSSPANPAAARPATYHELKAALPTADAAFIVSQQEANATVAQAQAAYMAHLSKQNLELTQKLNEQTIAAAASPLAPPKKPGLPAGVSALAAEAAGKSGGESGDAIEAFNEAVQAEMERTKCAKHVAHGRVCREQPQLRDAMVAGHNAQDATAKRR